MQTNRGFNEQFQISSKVVRVGGEVANPVFQTIEFVVHSFCLLFVATGDHDRGTERNEFFRDGETYARATAGHDGDGSARDGPPTRCVLRHGDV